MEGRKGGREGENWGENMYICGGSMWFVSFDLQNTWRQRVTRGEFWCGGPAVGWW